MKLMRSLLLIGMSIVGNASSIPAQEAATRQADTTTAAAAVESPPRPPAATRPPQNDQDFALLGEFVGTITVPADETAEGDSGDSQVSGEFTELQVGLQVRPMGGNRFEARQYEGGLPGQAEYSGQATPLTGYRAGDFLILSGGPWAIFVERDHCLLVDRQGRNLGRLERVQRTSPSLGAPPPENATVLFDGSNADHFSTASMTDEGLLMAGADVRPMFQDFNMHVEFRLPYMPGSQGQSRGNSGCYLLSRYEVQVLDSFSEEPTFNGCSSLYRQKAPDLNMCFPPLQWQTYDIRFTAPRWAAEGVKLRNARITVWHNGVKTQDDVEITDKTGAGKPEEPTLLPIRFQDHRDPVRFRNIWIIDRGLSDVGDFPPTGPAGE